MSERHPDSPAPRSACEAARERLLEHLEFSRAADSVRPKPSQFHCEDCRAWFERAQGLAGAITSLPRQESDDTPLEGLVVAALNAGRRQERAAASIATLERLQAPEALESRVHERLQNVHTTAPDELERRVAIELAGDAGPRIGRHLGRLDRLDAPAELDALVARSLAETRRGRVLPFRRLALVAAAMLAVLGAATLARQAGLFDEKPYEFRVVHVSSVAELGPLAQGTLSSISGGVFDLPGEAR